jgi:hypothetical protein
LLDEAWDAKPATINELVDQATAAPIPRALMLVDDVEDVFQDWAFLVTQVWLAICTVATLSRLTGQVRSSNAFDREVA